MFSVRWVSSALRDLAEFWADSDSETRQQITETVREIDRILETDAETAGESRDPGFRILLVAPLGVEYVIRDSERSAFVIRVWHFTVRSR
jgi:hypothetical protein